MAISRSRHSVISTAVALAGIAYPVLVYVGLNAVPSWVFMAGLAAVLALRFAVRPAGGADPFMPFLAAACFGTVLIVIVAPEAGVKFYPVMVNAALALLFALSLARPPSVIERLTRLSNPELPPAARNYLRKVTATWLGFFLLNGAIAAWTALRGSLEQWTLYNGFISYVLMAVLFIAELAVRRFATRATERGA
jgi:uncharacterized membrane protein